MLYNTTFKIPKKFAVSMHYKLYIYLDPFTNMSRLCHICTSKLEISIVLYITVKPIFCSQHGYKHKNIRLKLQQDKISKQYLLDFDYPKKNHYSYDENEIKKRL